MLLRSDEPPPPARLPDGILYTQNPRGEYWFQGKNPHWGSNTLADQCLYYSPVRGALDSALIIRLTG
jgi:hypothetical protein